MKIDGGVYPIASADAWLKANVSIIPKRGFRSTLFRERWFLRRLRAAKTLSVSRWFSGSFNAIGQVNPRSELDGCSGG
ncbi:MAG: hypothetical protein HQM08_19850 [Candidatus Riflebacteria bacterium]|nr:hypothetical protein [Candidatus Riflebacteria bacterium]